MSTLPGSTTRWEAEALWQALEPTLPGLSVEVLPEVGSTNSLLLARTQDSAPCLLVAERQTQGRGRMGRAWLSAPGSSLTFSLSLPLAPLHWEGLSLAVGLALAEALEPPVPARPPRLQLKWPNDLWLCDPAAADGTVGRKLGGVLIETAARRSTRLCVVGVGLNVLPLAAPQTPELSHGYACLQELQPGITAAQALARVALPLARALRRFESEGFAPLASTFAQRDLLRGRAVRTSGATALDGVAQGVDGDGNLLVNSPAQGLQRVHSGEVSVRLDAAVPAPAARGELKVGA